MYLTCYSHSNVDVVSAYANLTSLNEALLKAAAEGDLAKFRALMLCVEADINTIDTKTPLQYAAMKGHTAIVELLLGNERINVNLVNEDGNTALHYAAWKGHKNVVELLLGHEQINVNIVNYWGRTPLDTAAGHNHHGIENLIRRFLENGEL